MNTTPDSDSSRKTASPPQEKALPMAWQIFWGTGLMVANAFLGAALWRWFLMPVAPVPAINPVESLGIALALRWFCSLQHPHKKGVKFTGDSIRRSVSAVVAMWLAAETFRLLLWLPSTSLWHRLY